MGETCFRCGRDALATLNIEATIGTTRLKISGDAEPAGICPSCMVALAVFFGTGGELDLVPMPENAPTVLDREGSRA
jgi:hypothetical protein